MKYVYIVNKILSLNIFSIFLFRIHARNYIHFWKGLKLAKTLSMQYNVKLVLNLQYSAARSSVRSATTRAVWWPFRDRKSAMDLLIAPTEVTR